MRVDIYLLQESIYILLWEPTEDKRHGVSFRNNSSLCPTLRVEHSLGGYSHRERWPRTRQEDGPSLNAISSDVSRLDAISSWQLLRHTILDSSQFRVDGYFMNNLSLCPTLRVEHNLGGYSHRER